MARVPQSYIMGTRAYAEEVYATVDPGGLFFGGRILLRDESGSESSHARLESHGALKYCGYSARNDPYPQHCSWEYQNCMPALPRIQDHALMPAQTNTLVDAGGCAGLVEYTLHRRHHIDITLAKKVAYVDFVTKPL
jgi:hypothetical protein